MRAWSHSAPVMASRSPAGVLASTVTASPGGWALMPGRVARICLENGEFASLGATLMLIEPGA